ncbi:hypothetical protein PBI_KEPLER_64 [Arthrobacter phage Kepler]|uniref:Uncharacterized protein n=1 Tax=Arthrobacter phage Kepler TaxID=2419959 RepID=A0A3G2KH53_9CAUD|nr:hypothetical protein HOU55_gp64 [Arthrobacter phage Kepler]AYN58290.1 hypothetical protein PBI_KEPLER_64 [Arthrobacter phage Kepler]
MTGEEYGPADVVIDPDGTTWVRLEAYGVAVLANMDKLRELEAPPVGGYKFAGSEFERHTSRPGVGYFGGVVPVMQPGSWFGGVA